MGHVSRRIAVTVVAWLGLVLPGCDLFRPAVPEAPSGAAILPKYTTAEKTLETLALGIADKGRRNGAAAYIGGFADTAADGREFHVFFDRRTELRMQGQGVEVPPEGWNRSLEERFYNRLVRLSSVPADAEYGLQRFPDSTRGDPDELEATPPRLRRKYSLFAILANGDLLFIAQGSADLDFVNAPGSRWVITRWQDYEYNDAATNEQNVSLGQRRLEP